MIYSLLIGSVLLALPITFLLRRSKATAARSWRLLSVVIALAGILLLTYSSQGLESASERQSWPMVQGIVVRSEVVGERAYHPNIVYRYIVDSISYLDSTDLKQPTFGGKRSRYDVANKRSAEFIPGDSIEVYHDPSKPGTSALLPRADWSTYGQAAFGLLLFGIGLGLTLGLRGNQAGLDKPEDNSRNI